MITEALASLSPHVAAWRASPGPWPWLVDQAPPTRSDKERLDHIRFHQRDECLLQKTSQKATDHKLRG